MVWQLADVWCRRRALMIWHNQKWNCCVCRWTSVLQRFLKHRRSIKWSCCVKSWSAPTCRHATPLWQRWQRWVANWISGLMSFLLAWPTSVTCHGTQDPVLAMPWAALLMQEWVPGFMHWCRLLSVTSISYAYDAQFAVSICMVSLWDDAVWFLCKTAHYLGLGLDRYWYQILADTSQYRLVPLSTNTELVSLPIPVVVSFVGSSAVHSSFSIELGIGTVRPTQGYWSWWTVVQWWTVVASVIVKEINFTEKSLGIFKIIP